MSIIVNEDAAHSCINNMGQLKSGVIEFTDLNEGLTPFQRRYVSHIKRCDELERRLKFFQSEIEKFGLPCMEAGSVDAFLQPSQGEVGEPSHKSGMHLLETLEVTLEKYEQQLRELNAFSEQLSEEFYMKVELQEVMINSQGLMNEVGYMTGYQSGGLADDDLESTGGIGTSLLGEGGGGLDMRFSSLTGVIPQVEKGRFERMLFRATRGNCFPHFMEIEQAFADPNTGQLVQKMAFVVFYKSKTIETKIKKICGAFDARLYSVPDLNDKEGVRARVNENAKEMREARKILLVNRQNRLELCTVLADHVAEWTWTVLREKTIYHTLNLFKADVSGMLRAEGWVVESSMGKVQAALTKAHKNMDDGATALLEPVPKPWPTAPTYFETNKFTYPFQEFVDTYGVPRYKEANPALFTAVTFPFLFGVMYGDIGHGFVIFLGGLMLVLSERSMENKKMDEMSAGVFAARYMFLLMGAFGVYAGIVYNDFFAIGLNWFGSEWEWKHGLDTKSGTTANMTEGCSYGDATCIYPFGVDPAWHISTNELLFFNSMKMKLSVIIGILQMTVGICLKGLNALFFEEQLDFFFEFIPMLIFDMAFFGYMVVLIFMKWMIDWDARMYSATCNADHDLYPKCLDGTYTTADLCPLDYGGSGDGCQPPNLITTLMNMALMPGTVDEPLYPGQAGIQVVLLLLAVACVPVILLAKPLMIRSRMNAEHGHTSSFSENPLIDEKDGYGVVVEHNKGGGGHGEGGGGHGSGHGGDHEEEHDFSEIVIHQAIETIEFVLGMVSNTASYLRLWALSLAHTELATVFWEKAMLTTINSGSPIAIVAGYAIFAGVTFAVLIVMDVLECFLHALRLHWVEFQNKFFKADGYKFTPLSFKRILLAA